MILLGRGAVQDLRQADVQVGDNFASGAGPLARLQDQLAFGAGKIKGNRLVGMDQRICLWRGQSGGEEIQPPVLDLEAGPGEQAAETSGAQEAAGLFLCLTQAGCQRGFARLDAPADPVPQPLVRRVAPVELLILSLPTYQVLQGE